MLRSKDSPATSAPTTFGLINSWFPDENQPYLALKRRIHDLARSDDIVLEIGSRSLSPPRPKLQDFVEAMRGIDRTDMATVTNASIDIAFCRCMAQPVSAINRFYSDLFRALKPGGFFVFLAPNYWGFERMLSRFIPHQFDRSAMADPGARVPKHAEMMLYQSNTARSIKRLTKNHGFTIEQLEFLDQSPCIPSDGACSSSRYAAMLTRNPMFRHLRGLIMGTLKKKFMRDLL